MSTPTILCVDDERNVLLILRTQLMRHFPNYAIEIAESGEEALALVDELTVEGVEIPLVIADQIMPGMQGDEFLIQLHTHYPQILKVMLTGQAKAEDVGNVVNRGNLYRFISKPWNEVDLSLTVTQALLRYEQEQQLIRQQAALEQANRKLEALNADLERQVQERTQQWQQSEECYRLLSEISPVGIFRNDIQGQCTYANPKTLEITGLSLDENLGESWRKHQHPDDRDWMDTAWSNFVAQIHLGHEVEYKVEYRYLYPDGSLRWALAQAVPEYNATEELVGFIGSVVDITDRKQAELAFQEALEFNQQVIATAQEGIIVWDQDLHYRMWNRFMEDLSGIPTTAVLGQYCLTIFPFLQENGIFALLERALAGETVNAPDTFFSISASGKSGWSSERFAPLRDAQGNIVGVLGTVHDITERKLAEIALRESEYRYATLAEAAPVGIFRNDATGKMVYANHRWSEVTGLTLEEGLDNGWIQRGYLDCRDRLSNDWEHCDQQGTVTHHDMESCLQMPDGSLKWVYCQVKPEKDIDGNTIGYVGTLTDITDLKQAEAALLEAQRLARLGNWSFNVQTQEITWSEEIYRMFGLDSSQPVPPYPEYLQKIHPEDRPQLQRCIEQAIANGTSYILDYRIILPEGSIRHHEGRGEAIRNAQGQVVKLCGTTMDISDRKRAELAVQSLLKGTASVTGRAFFPILAQQIAIALNASCVILATQSGNSLNTLGYCVNGQIEANRSFDLSHSPFDKAMREGFYSCKEHVQRVFPLAAGLASLKAASYVGIALKDVNGEVIGTLSAISRQTLRDQDYAQNLLRIFAARASAELERLQAQQALEQLNQVLEQRVQERTQAFEQQTHLLQTILNSMGDGVLVANTTGEIILHNPAAEQIPGLGMPPANPEQLHNFWGIYRPDRTPCFMDELPLMQAIQGNAVNQVEFMVRNIHHSDQIYIEVTACPLTDEDGNIIGGVAVLRNVSERKQAEIALRRQLAAVEAALDGIAIFNGDAFVYLNEAHAHIFGYASPAELLSKGWRTLYRPEEIRFFEREVFPVLQQQRHWRGEVKARRKDGSTFDEEVAFIISEDGDWISICRDISDRKLAAAQLQEKEHFLRSIFEGTENPLFVVDVLKNGDFCYVGWNLASEKISGFCAADVLGKTPIQLMGIEQGSVFSDNYRRCVEAGEAIHYEENIFVPHGSVWTLTTLNPLRTSDGKIFRIVGNVLNITDRKHAEIQLLESQQFAQSIAENTPNIIYIYDLDLQRNIYCNREVFTILGYSTEQIHSIGSNALSSLIHPDDWPQVMQYHQLIAVAQDHEIIEQEYRMRHADGNWRYLSDRVTVFKRDADGRVLQYIGAALDITDRKHAEHALRDSEARGHLEK
jgi:PAS domain S-box-containing protein